MKKRKNKNKKIKKFFFKKLSQVPNILTITGAQRKEQRFFEFTFFIKKALTN